MCDVQESDTATGDELRKRKSREEGLEVRARGRRGRTDAGRLPVKTGVEGWARRRLHTRKGGTVQMAMMVAFHGTLFTNPPRRQQGRFCKLCAPPVLIAEVGLLGNCLKITAQ